MCEGRSMRSESALRTPGRLVTARSTVVGEINFISSALSRNPLVLSCHPITASVVVLYASVDGNCAIEQRRSSECQILPINFTPATSR